MKKVFGKEVFVLCFAMSALVLAAVSLNTSLGLLISDDKGSIID